MCMVYNIIFIIKITPNKYVEKRNVPIIIYRNTAAVPQILWHSTINSILLYTYIFNHGNLFNYIQYILNKRRTIEYINLQTIVFHV